MEIWAIVVISICCAAIAALIALMVVVEWMMRRRQRADATPVRAPSDHVTKPIPDSKEEILTKLQENKRKIDRPQERQKGAVEVEDDAWEQCKREMDNLEKGMNEAYQMIGQIRQNLGELDEYPELTDQEHASVRRMKRNCAETMEEWERKSTPRSSLSTASLQMASSASLFGRLAGTITRSAPF